MVLGRSRGETRTVEGGNIGKVLARDAPEPGPGAADAVVRAILKGCKLPANL